MPHFLSAGARLLLVFALAAAALLLPPSVDTTYAQEQPSAGPDAAAIACTDAAFAAALAAGGLITFACGPAPVTITVANRRTINKAVTIDGGGFITLSGGNQDGILDVLNTGSLTLRNLSMTGAFNYPAVLNRGTLVVENVTFQDNDRPGVNSSAFTGETVTVVIRNSRFYRHKRPAILAQGSTVTIEDTVFMSNSVPSALGSAIDAEGQNTVVHVSNSEFRHNHSRDGGAIYTGSDTEFTIQDTIFYSNTASGGGGAIYASGQMEIERVLFDTNEGYGGGAIQNRGDLTVTDSDFRNNTVIGYSGGAISHFNQTQSESSLTVRNVTFRGTRGKQSGGAVAFEAPHGTMLLENVTFADTRAEKGGAVYFEDGVGTVRHATFVDAVATNSDGDNVQAGDSPANAGTLAVYNSIFANGGCFGPFSGAGSVQAPGADCGAALTANPQLNALAPAGAFAPLFTFASGSPAKNAAVQAHCADFDQRGITRPQQGGCDAGAFEFGATPGLTAVRPNRVGAGTGAFILFAEGSNFLGGSNGSRVLWNGSPLATTMISPTLLMAAVPDTLTMNAGTAMIQVETPVSGVPDGGIAPGTRTVEIAFLRYLPVVTKQ